MKRSEFIRKSILAALAIAVAPSTAVQHVEPKQYKPKQSAYFKCSKEMLEDKEAFNREIEHLTRNIKGEPISTTIGWEGDDFQKGMFTVVIKFS